MKIVHHRSQITRYWIGLLFVAFSFMADSALGIIENGCHDHCTADLKSTHESDDSNQSNSENHECDHCVCCTNICKIPPAGQRVICLLTASQFDKLSTESLVIPPSPTSDIDHPPQNLF